MNADADSTLAAKAAIRVLDHEGHEPREKRCAIIRRLNRFHRWVATPSGLSPIG